MQTRSPVVNHSVSPRTKGRHKANGDSVTETRTQQKGKAKKEVLQERAVDRRTRRYKQAVREEEIAQRKRNGKKPFYLTLDAEGKPYGVGRRTWIADVWKLAAALDVSCCHISRQTYEAVTTYKERLNKNFEYSGMLNEIF